MAASQVMALAQSALMLLLTIAGPLLLTSLIVGVIVGLLQALTQIQETTLTFVPKVVAMGVMLLLMLPMMGQAMADFMAKLSNLIITSGS